MSIFLMALAGGVGAALRFVVDALIRARFHTALPLGTLLINISGSFALGLLTGWASAQGGADALTLILGTGLLGGYTTFSTANVEIVRLIQSKQFGTALLTMLGTMILCVAVAAAGFLLTRG